MHEHSRNKVVLASDNKYFNPPKAGTLPNDVMLLHHMQDAAHVVLVDTAVLLCR